MKFEEKFVAFVDILGFKNLVTAAENGTGLPLTELTQLLEQLGTQDDVLRVKKSGPTTCPQSPYINRDLDFQLTQISDCVIVSSEISPAGAIKIINHCWGAVIQLMTKGIMCRGYISKGSVYHTDKQIIGSGYQDAYSRESGVSAFKNEAEERGTPFVEIDPVVCNYVENCGDDCVRTMYSRMVETDGSLSALFPFKRLSHSFMIGGFGRTFDPEKEKASNNDMRKIIENIKTKVMSFVDESNPKAFQKASHYIRALDSQLDACDRTEAMIDMLCKPIGPR